MVMVGVFFKILFDDIVSVMYRVGKSLLEFLREIVMGGIVIIKEG